MRVFIHSGYLSVQNGASFPLTFYFDLAKALGVPAETGSSYYDDSLDIPEEDWPVAKELLDHAKMLYRIHRVHGLGDWQNVQTDEVRRQLAPKH